MPSIEYLIPRLIATAVFAFTPGQGMFQMAVQTMAHGVKADWLSSFAFHVAPNVHIMLVAFHIAVLLQTAPMLLVGLELTSASYLHWMASYASSSNDAGGLKTYRVPRLSWV